MSDERRTGPRPPGNSPAAVRVWKAQRRAAQAWQPEALPREPEPAVPDVGVLVRRAGRPVQTLAFRGYKQRRR